MGFVGNDIISLCDRANLRSFSDVRYLNKVLTANELGLIKDNPDLTLLPYIFWTCKESGYKIAMKKGTEHNFVPQYFEVVSFDYLKTNGVEMLSGVIVFEHENHYFQSILNTRYISTLTCCNKEDLLIARSVVGSTSKQNHSEMSRHELKTMIASEYPVDASQITIFKTDNGIPYLKTKSNFNADISLSHDGIFYAFAYLVNNNFEQYAG